MREVSIRELRTHGGDIVARVEAGERVIVMPSGKPVAELRRVLATHLSATVLLPAMGALARGSADSTQAR